MNSGRFVVFEGPDGAGKTTAMTAVAGRLRETGREVVQTREPGGSTGAEAMRSLLMTETLQHAPVLSQLLLITAARVDHLDTTILPAIQRGAVVLCDRYVDSSYIYQCRLGGVPLDVLDQLNTLLKIRMPDLRLFFELPAAVALSRMTARAEKNRFDLHNEERWLELADAYRWRAEQAPETVRRVNAALSLEEVVTQCWEHIHESG